MPNGKLDTTDGKGWNDILPDQTSAHIEETINNKEPSTKVDSPRFKTAFAAPTKRGKRLPCYGWIEDDEEEEDDDDFITLQPSSMVLGPPKAALPRADA